MPKDLLGNMRGCNVLGFGSGKCNGSLFLQTLGNGATSHHDNVATDRFLVRCVGSPVGITKYIEVGVQNVVITSIHKFLSASVLEIAKNMFDGDPMDWLWFLGELCKFVNSECNIGSSPYHQVH